MFNKYLCCTLIAVSWCITAWAQEVKNEIEVSVSKNLMPPKALEMLAPLLPEARKVRYYRETNGDQVSYEGKMRWRGHTYSIEFNQEGELQDVEQLVKFSALPNSIREQIVARLQQEFSRYKVRKTQVQYSMGHTSLPDQEVIKALIDEGNKLRTVRYELEVDGQEASGVKSYELLFDTKGDLLNKRIIVSRPLDNLIFGH